MSFAVVCSHALVWKEMRANAHSQGSSAPIRTRQVVMRQTCRLLLTSFSCLSLSLVLSRVLPGGSAALGVKRYVHPSPCLLHHVGLPAEWSVPHSALGK